MRNIYLIIVFSFFLSLCGCADISEIENKRIVTACIVERIDNDTNYGFYVSLPKSDGEEEGAKALAKLYSFNAKNFSNALYQFEESGNHKIDLSHMSLFAGNREYFDKIYISDESLLRENIPVYSLVNVCVMDCTKDELSRCIDDEYSSKADTFSKSILESKKDVVNTNLTKLSISLYNKYFTSQIPVVEIVSYGENKLAKIKTLMLFSENNKTTSLTSNEYDLYMKWKKSVGNKKVGYSIDIKSDNLNIEIKDKSMLDIARKYALMNVDFLNVKYNARKCFLFYDKYEDYLKNYNLMDARFTGE